MDTEILITYKEYNELKKKADKLEALEVNGVDNWVGYSVAMEDFNDEEDFVYEG